MIIWKAVIFDENDSKDLALELNMDDAIDLLGRAGIALSDANLFDLIIEYCIENCIYDLFTVNAILFEHDQLLLGG